MSRTFTITEVTTYYYITDHVGSIRSIVDDGGFEVSHEDFDPFGAPLPGRSQDSGLAYQQNKFTGHERDSEDGLDLDYMQSRTYDPDLGRFLSVDPLAEDFAGWTPYHYVHNNPINMVDPTGMAAEPPGDYYDNYGNWLGKDKYDDKKVYHADAVTKGKDGLVISATNAIEWNYSISDAKFKEYYPTLLSHEGGFVNHKNDSGGSTNKGITLKSFEKYSMDLLNVQPTLDNLQRLTDNQAAAIYENGYWNPSGAGNISDKQVGWLYFDTYVNGGASSVLGNTIKAYGGSGKGINTLNSIIKANSGESIYNTYKQERLNRYDRIIQSNPKLESFRKGWENRVNCFQYQTD